MKELIPENFKFQCCPMMFNSTKVETLRSLVIENTKDIYMVKIKILIFN